jgi:hypothetical protein
LERPFFGLENVKGLQSQCASILKWMREGKPVTPLVALDQFGCFRLAARINDLKASGHDIHSQMITVTNRDGSQSKVAEYRLLGAAS